MQFLDTAPFAYDEHLPTEQRVAIERYRVRHREQMLQALTNLRHREAPVRIGLPESSAFFTATLWSVDAQAERMVFHAAREPGVLQLVTSPERLWGAAYDATCKVQFDLRGRTVAAHGDFLAVTSYLPSAIYLMPRRADVRTRHAPGHEPCVVLKVQEAPLRLPIHDISARGFSFLLDPHAARITVGDRLCGAEIELVPGEFLFADFEVRNVFLHDEDGGRFRFGCTWTLLSPEAERLIERWTQRSLKRRTMLTLDL